jgi:hypothetical protein
MIAIGEKSEIDVRVVEAQLVITAGMTSDNARSAILFIFFPHFCYENCRMIPQITENFSGKR